MDIEEANAELTDTEFEQWKKLRTKRLYREAERNQDKIIDRDEKVIDTLIKSGKDELVMSVELFGGTYDFFVNLDTEQRQIFNEIKKLKREADKNDEELEDVEGVGDLIIKFLASISLDFKYDDFNRVKEELGFVGLYRIFIKVMSEFKNQMESNKDLIRKFRKS